MAGVDSRLLEVLGRASSLELLQLKGVISGCWPIRSAVRPSA
ncbi:hypothetical protein [Pseudacidovorax intermedius]|nr:hypothetical protein [Pseudacidovorax intermedius]